MERMDSAEQTSRPAGQRMVRRACLGLALASMVANSASPALALSAQDQDWQQYNLPPRDTVVDVETNFGLYRLPIGYIKTPGVLKSVEIAPDLASGRHRYRAKALAFHFTMPDGHQNSSEEWFRPKDDGGDGIGIDPNRYLVWVTRMDRPVPGGRPSEVAVLDLDVPPDRLILTSPSDDHLSPFYEAWTRAGSNNERVGIQIGCLTLSGVCLGHIFVPSQTIVLEFSIQIERLTNVVAVTHKILQLLDEWKIKYRK